MPEDRERGPFPGAVVGQGDTMGTPLASIPTSVPTRKAQQLLRHRLRGHYSGLAFLASVACMAAVALLISICSRNQMRRQAFHSRARYLSDEQTPNHGLANACDSNSTGEEAWLAAGGDGPAEGEPPAKRPHLEEGPSGSVGSQQILVGSREEGGSAGETMAHQTQVAPRPTAPPMPSKEVKGKTLTDRDLGGVAALLELQGGGKVKVHLGAVGGAAVGRVLYVEGTGPPSTEPTPEGASARRMAVPIAAFLASQPSAAPRHPRIAPKRVLGRPAVRERRTRESMASLIVASMRNGPNAAARRPVVTPAAGVETGTAAGTAAGDAAGAAGNLSSGPSTGAGGEHAWRNPFLYLPSVLSENPVHFDGYKALQNGTPPLDPVPLLCTAHELLTRPVLTELQAKILANAAEQLVSHSLYFQKRPLPLSRPSRAAATLGVRYLVFETVVATLLALGDRLEGEWWDRFCNEVPHSYPYLPVFPSGRLDVGYNRMLLNTLVRALGTLKRGSRLPAGEAAVLHRLLFTASFSPQRFLAPAFNSWRESLQLL